MSICIPQCTKNINYNNLEIPKKNFYKNLMTTFNNPFHHEDCIWYQTNGISWHTLFQIKSSFDMIRINGSLQYMMLPNMIFHIYKDKNNNYEVDIFFQNIFCEIHQVIETFLIIDNKKLDFECINNNYIQDSLEMIKYLINDYNFEYEDLDSYKSMNDIQKINMFNNMKISNIDLNEFLIIWKKQLTYELNQENITKLIINKGFKQTNSIIKTDNISIKNFIICGMSFEHGKIIFINSIPMKIVKIDVENDIKKSIKNNFMYDKIVLYNTTTQKINNLRIRDIIQKKILNIYDINEPITKIKNTNIRIGNYVKKDDSYSKIQRIIFYKDDYNIKIFNKFGYMYDYNLLSMNHDIDAYDLYDILKVEKGKLFPFFDLIFYNCIVNNYRFINTNRYTLEDIFFINDNDVINKLSGNRCNIPRMIEILKNIQISEVIENFKNINKYIWKFSLHNTQMYNFSGEISSHIISSHIISDFIYIENSLVNYIPEKIKINENTNLKMPCEINEINFNTNDIYILNFELEIVKNIWDWNTYKKNRLIPTKILYIQYEKTYNYLQIYYKNLINNKIKSIKIYLHNNNNNNNISLNYLFNKSIDPIGILDIGYIGKLSLLNATMGFKKSKKYEIIAFYKKYNNKKMVLFDNGISVEYDLVIDSDFAPESKRNIKPNNEIISYNDLIDYYNSSKQIKKFITYLQPINIILCEIEKEIIDNGR